MATMRTFWSLFTSAILYAILTTSGTSANKPVVKFFPDMVTTCSSTTGIKSTWLFSGLLAQSDVEARKTCREMGFDLLDYAAFKDTSLGLTACVSTVLKSALKRYKYYEHYLNYWANSGVKGSPYRFSTAHGDEGVEQAPGFESYVMCSVGWKSRQYGIYTFSTPYNGLAVTYPAAKQSCAFRGLRMMAENDAYPREWEAMYYPVFKDLYRNSNYWLMGGKRFVVANFKSPTSREIIMEIFSDPGLKNGVLCVQVCYQGFLREGRCVCKGSYAGDGCRKLMSRSEISNCPTNYGFSTWFLNRDAPNGYSWAEPWSFSIANSRCHERGFHVMNFSALTTGTPQQQQCRNRPFARNLGLVRKYAREGIIHRYGYWSSPGKYYSNGQNPLWIANDTSLHQPRYYAACWGRWLTRTTASPQTPGSFSLARLYARTVQSYRFASEACDLIGHEQLSAHQLYAAFTYNAALREHLTYLMLPGTHYILAEGQVLATRYGGNVYFGYTERLGYSFGVLCGHGPFAAIPTVF
eukprot:scpid57370/ scgid29989/ 